MHPDAIIEGLKRELGRLDEDAEDFADRKGQIEQEIRDVGSLPRPEATPEEPETVVDRARSYLEGLYRELERAEESRHDEIAAEIQRVEDHIEHRSESTVTEPVAVDTGASSTAEATEPKVASDPENTADATAENGGSEA